MLQSRGWLCQSLTGPRLDQADGVAGPSLLAQHGAWMSRDGIQGGVPFSVHQLQSSSGRHVVYQTAGQSSQQTEHVRVFLELCIDLLHESRPDIVLTYGGGTTGRAVIALAKLLGLPVVFWLRNSSYENARLFDPVDGVIVPCDFARRSYQQRLGLTCMAIPSPVVAERVRCEKIQPKYVTFVNPQPQKGVFFFAGLYQQLSRAAPEIEFLIVEGRAGTKWLDMAIPQWRQQGNIRFMSATPDPRRFYEVSRVILMPSLWQETFSRVPVEAFVNGIPVVASDRGGLPENCRQAGFALPIPMRCVPEQAVVPTAAEVAPWCELVLRLCRDRAFWEQESARARAAAEEFSESIIAARHEAALLGVIAGPKRRITGTVEELLAAFGQPRDFPAKIK